MKLKLIVSLAMLFTGILPPIQLSAQTAYNLTVKAGPLRQAFQGFGASQASTRWDLINTTARNTMADMVYRDLRMNALRLWVSCAPGKTVADMVTELNTTYIASGAIADITSRGVTTLLLAPSGSGAADPASVPDYADNIAETILQLRDNYGVTINVTGIANEPSGWTNAAVVGCVKELRARLDSRGLTAVKIIAPEGSSPSAAAIQAQALSDDPDAWGCLYGIASHSYGFNLCTTRMEVLKEGLKWWMTEASDSGSELAEDENRASTILSRFLCELNHGSDEWIFFIGLGQTGDINYYPVSTAYLMLYDIKTASIVTYLKYYYFKQALNAFDPGIIMRKTVSETEGDMLSVHIQNPAISAAAGYNTDGSWAINIVNQTGITGSPAATNNLYYDAATYDVTVTVEELANTPSMDFTVYRSRANNHVVASGTLTLLNGVGTITVASKEIVSLRSAATSLAIPPTPNGLITSNINAPITLIWNNTVKATSWNVKRATTSGGPYTTIATTADTRFDDLSAADGTVYYYVVSALNAAGESANSAEVVTSPTAFPWVNTDIGTVSVTGSCSVSDYSVFNIYGSGSALGTASDSFNFTYQTMTGNGTLIAHLTKAAEANTRIGIAMSETLGTAPKAAILFFNFNGYWNRMMMFKRTTEGTAASLSVNSFNTVPTWFKLTRQGNVFTGYASGDGANWTTISSGTMAMANTIYAGPVICSGGTATTTLAVFDNVIAQAPVPTGLRQVSATPGQITLGWTASYGAASYNIKRATVSGGPYTTVGTVTAPVLSYADTTVADGTNYYYVVSAVNPQGESADSDEFQTWTNTNVGSVGLSSSCTISPAGGFTVISAGTSLGGTVDSFNFTYKIMTGDGSLIVRLNSGNRANSKGGILMTETLGTAPRAVSLIYNFNGYWNQVMFNKRTTEGSYGTWTGSSFTTVPVWLKLTRAGNIFTGYASYDGTTWTSVSSATISMSSAIYIGLADCASTNSLYSTLVFDNVTAP